MNTDSRSAVELAKAVVTGSVDVAGKAVDVAVIPPFVYLQSVGQAIDGSRVTLASQDVYTETE